MNHNPSTSRSKPPDVDSYPMVLAESTTHGDSRFMEVESQGQPHGVSLFARLKDVGNGSNRFFPTVSTLMEQLHEEFEEPINELDTPLKVS